MNLLVKDTGTSIGIQSIVYDPSIQQHFLVTSVDTEYVSKTYIVKSRKNGAVDVWDSVYVQAPANHKEVLTKLTNGELTVKDFNFIGD